MAGFPGWQAALLGALHAPATPTNLAFLNSWQAAEGGGARFNPLNTTWSVPGAGAYNSVGVRNYGSAQQGIKATLQTLLARPADYGQIVSGLRAGNITPQALARYVQTSPWGTHSFPGLGVSSADTSVPPSPPSSIPGQQPQSRQALLASLLHAADTGNYMPVYRARQQGIGQSTAQGEPIPQAPGAKATLALHAALGQQGVPYRWGGTTPSGFDCSGLVQFAWARAGISVPRTSEAQWTYGQPVTKLQPGDAVFFRGAGGAPPGHEAMYIGGGKVIVAPHTGGHVQVVPLSSIGGYMGARRFA